jgi:hypothetical protein
MTTTAYTLFTTTPTIFVDVSADHTAVVGGLNHSTIYSQSLSGIIPGATAMLLKDNTYALHVYPAGATTSDRIGFLMSDLGIPDNSLITGVEVKITTPNSTDVPFGTTVPYYLQFTVGTMHPGDVSYNGLGTPQTYTLGSATDTWGISPATGVNFASLTLWLWFGSEAGMAASSLYFQLDAIEVRLTYTNIGSLPAPSAGQSRLLLTGCGV